MNFLPRRGSATRARAAKYLTDLAIWSLVVPLAFLLRQASNYEGIWLYLALGFPVKVALLYFSRIERRSWSKSSVQDLLALAWVVGLGAVILFGVGLMLYSGPGFPRTVPIIAGVLAFLGMGGVRLGLRIFREEGVRNATGSVQRVLLVGAGEAGSRMAREIRRSPAIGMLVAGYLDDDPQKRGLRIGGAEVAGAVEDLARVSKTFQVDEVLITMPSATGVQMRRVVELARVAGVHCRILPSLAQLLSGEADITAIREVQVEDLLRREAVRLDEVGLEAYIRDQVVLVTGAAGSIGSEIVRQIARFGPEHVVLVDHGENILHDLEGELSLDLPGLDYTTVVGSVCDGRKMAAVFATHGPKIVFHCAAHKHVGMMQYNLDEAILNNIGGTRTVAETALAAGTDRFVNISTDKAVNPLSVMGRTKFLAEQVVLSLSEEAGDGQAFVSVRFGNVLGSRGSVVPIFQEQIRRGGPVTVTDLEATRYFMTIAEAAQLVIQAGALADNGHVYVLDMGEPVRIVDLAEDLIRLSGGDPEDLEIVFTGLVSGEKLHEELFTECEQPQPTVHEKILATRHLDPPIADLGAYLDELLAVAEERDWAGIDAALAVVCPAEALSPENEPGR